jgi:hypothetical protein
VPRPDGAHCSGTPTASGQSCCWRALRCGSAGSGQRFRDPSSGMIMRVWIDPSDESRHHVPDDASAPLRAGRRTPVPPGRGAQQLGVRAVVWAGSACGTGAGHPLVAWGRTDAQIAAQLYICVRTVGSHLDRIRDRIGCRRRVGSPASRSAPAWSYPGRAGAGSSLAAGPAPAGLPAQRRYIRRTGRGLGAPGPTTLTFIR